MMAPIKEGSPWGCAIILPEVLANLQKKEKQEVILVNLQQDPKNGDLYFRLARTLATGETILLPDGSVLDNKNLGLLALECYESKLITVRELLFNSYQNSIEGITDQVVIGQFKSRANFLLAYESVSCHERALRVYEHLRVISGADDESKMNKVLMANIFKSQELLGKAYNYMGVNLPEGRAITLPDQSQSDKAGLFWRAMHYAPYDRAPLQNFQRLFTDRQQKLESSLPDPKS